MYGHRLIFESETALVNPQRNLAAFVRRKNTEF